MPRKPKYAYITRYALTQGIFKREVKEYYDASGSITVRDRAPYQKGDWHRTEKEAALKAEEMRLARIKSLEKQIQKLENLSFDKLEFHYPPADTRVVIYRNNDLGKECYAILMEDDTEDFWLNSFKTHKEAENLIKKQGWICVEYSDTKTKS